MAAIMAASLGLLLGITANQATDDVTPTCTFHPAVGDAVLLQGGAAELFFGRSRRRLRCGGAARSARALLPLARARPADLPTGRPPIRTTSPARTSTIDPDRTTTAINVNGLILQSARYGELRVRVPVRPWLTAPVDVLFVTVKAPDMLAALARAPASLLGRGGGRAVARRGRARPAAARGVSPGRCGADGGGGRGDPAGAGRRRAPVAVRRLHHLRRAPRVQPPASTMSHAARTARGSRRASGSSASCQAGLHSASARRRRTSSASGIASSTGPSDRVGSSAPARRASARPRAPALDLARGLLGGRSPAQTPGAIGTRLADEFCEGLCPPVRADDSPRQPFGGVQLPGRRRTADEPMSCLVQATAGQGEIALLLGPTDAVEQGCGGEELDHEVLSPPDGHLCRRAREGLRGAEQVLGVEPQVPAALREPGEVEDGGGLQVRVGEARHPFPDDLGEPFGRVGVAVVDGVIGEVDQAGPPPGAKRVDPGSLRAPRAATTASATRRRRTPGRRQPRRTEARSRASASPRRWARPARRPSTAPPSSPPAPPRTTPRTATTRSERRPAPAPLLDTARRRRARPPRHRRDLAQGQPHQRSRHPDVPTGCAVRAQLQAAGDHRTHSSTACSGGTTTPATGGTRTCTEYAHEHRQEPSLRRRKNEWISAVQRAVGRRRWLDCAQGPRPRNSRSTPTARSLGRPSVRPAPSNCGPQKHLRPSGSLRRRSFASSLAIRSLWAEQGCPPTARRGRAPLNRQRTAEGANHARTDSGARPRRTGR